MPVPGRLVIVREGFGEAGAIENLVARTAMSLGLLPSPFASIPPSPRKAITTPETAVEAAEIAARLDPAAVLLTADLDDDCPKINAPLFAQACRDRGFSFPIAIVLFYREFETLIISVADKLAGVEIRSPGGQPIMTLQQPQTLLTDPESKRDAKGWVAENLMSGVNYKPTVHQLPLTRAMNVEELREAGLSSFRRLENGLKYLAAQIATSSDGVYP